MNRISKALGLAVIITHSIVMADSHIVDKRVLDGKEISDISTYKSGIVSNLEPNKQISKEIQYLTEELEKFPENNTRLTKKLGTPIVTRISQWIHHHYEELSEEQKEKIKQFIANAKLNANGKYSIGFYKKLAHDFIEIRKDIDVEKNSI